MVRRGGWTAALAVVALAAGCAHTAPTRFYLLQATAEHPVPGQAATGPAVVVGQVQVPAYLDRRQIVSRLGDSEVSVAEFHQWAEPLADGVRRVLIEDLSRKLVSERVSAGGSLPAQSAAFQLTVILQRFDRGADGEVVLAAHWLVETADAHGPLAERLTTLRVPVSGKDDGAQVDALSRALGTLSDQIADVIRAAMPAPQSNATAQ